MAYQRPSRRQPWQNAGKMLCLLYRRRRESEPSSAARRFPILAFPRQPAKAKPLTQWLRWRVLADCALWLWKSFACPLRPITEISNTARHRLATANSICRKYNLFLHLQKSRLGLPSWRAVSYHSIPAPKPVATSRGFCAPYRASYSPAPCGRCRHGACPLRRPPTTAWEFAQAAP